MESHLQWISELPSGGEFYRLFEHIPELMFFVKDADSRIIAGNHRFLEHCGVLNIGALHGKSDFEIFPKYMAENFHADDKLILKTGKPILGIVELFPTRDGLPKWFTTHKYPIFGNDGRPCGVCGIVQSHESSVENANDPAVRMARHIKANYRSQISIPELSRKCGLSQRQLERLFKRRFRISPREYITRFRILVAADALRQTTAPITDIALEAGFYDHSSFTRLFTKSMGLTPSHYRKSGTM